MHAYWRNRYEVAIQAAHEAGQLALEYFDRELEIEWKENRSPVTVADRQAEELLRTRLLNRFPDDGFLGEEYGSTPGSSGFRWIIDPIDGTRSFVRGIPIWATLVGLEHRGELIAGICRLPAFDQTYRALRGDGAFRDERKLSVSRVDTLEKAHVYYSSIRWFARGDREHEFLQLVKLTERQRGFGDFYGYVLVAQGSGELMVDNGLHPWDLAALIPIVEEAGGQMTTWDNTIDLNRPDVIASNGLLHQTALKILHGEKPS